ncbi:unnamed protein product [Schistosoma curassoni]|uniref:Uncharacterized protein n=1 Tax=Schistosoma curassoni TaxID=6186 RepID=A0A183JCZ8_9TREM|nr:unnamed protein product [Schistosoma curassoni]
MLEYFDSVSTFPESRDCLVCEVLIETELFALVPVELAAETLVFEFCTEEGYRGLDGGRSQRFVPNFLLISSHGYKYFLKAACKFRGPALKF